MMKIKATARAIIILYWILPCGTADYYRYLTVPGPVVRLRHYHSRDTIQCISALYSTRGILTITYTHDDLCQKFETILYFIFGKGY